MTLRIKAVAGSLAVLLSLAACGGEDLSKRPPDQIINDAKAAALAAKSVHITGTLTQQGSEGKVDILLTNNGDGKEEITSGNQTVSVIKVGDSLYLKGVPGLEGSGYKKVPLSDPKAASLAKAVDKKSFLEQAFDTKQRYTVAGPGKVGDQESLKLTPEGGQPVLHVANDAEKPYPLRIEGTGSKGAIAINFADWDSDAKVVAPPAS